METGELATREAGLSAAKRALLERWKRGQALPEKAPGILRRDPSGPAPLSFSQQRLWVLDRLEPGNPAYNLRALVRISGRLDRRALAAACREIVSRHEVLRTVFREAANGPVQVVLDRMDLDLPSIDLAGLPAERREGESAVLAQDLAGRPFDLGCGPLMRVALLTLEPGEHRLLLAKHHIVSDGWSMGVMLGELATLYGAFARGERSPLAPLALQYTDFAAWQQRQWEEGAGAADLDYWRRQLAGAPEGLELPADRSRPARQSFHGASCPVALGADATAALAALAREEGATLFMALLAVYQVLLLRYTSQEDLPVGSPVAGRPRRELEGLIGFFVNTLVLRGDLAGDPTFRELLGRVRRTALAAYEHQGLPFERLVEELQPDRDLGRNPLFQTMFALQNTPLPEHSLPGLTLRQMDLESRTAMFDLTVSLREKGGEVAGWLEHSADLFEPATGRRLAVHLARLAASAAATPDRRLSELPLLTDEERAQLVLWNERSVPYGLDACLHELVRRWAREAPDAPAVACGEEWLSYGELARRACRLARRLRGLGVGPEVPVALCAGRSTSMVVGMLGILEAGGAYLPLDAGYPRERLALMLEDAGAPVLLVERRLAGAVPAGEAVVLHLDGGWAQGASEEGWHAAGGHSQGADSDGVSRHAGSPNGRHVDDAASNDNGLQGADPVNSDPDSLAYVIYTSGSTGRPKGVACAHRGVLNLMADLERRRPLVRGEACGLWTSISFDVSVWEVFSALCYGGVLHLPSEDERASAAALFPWMARHRIRSLYLPPFLLAEYAEWVRRGGGERRTLARLLVGVEPIRERVLASLSEAVPGLAIVNGYGPTEATVCATFYDLPPGPAPERRTPLGLALANCRVHLIDEQLREVPVGVPGEVWIGGVGLARGYLGRPEVTADRFVPDPVAGPGVPAGARCYRTGDLARRLPDGNLEFLGRRDQQVKLRGFRIELGEIEAALALHPGVRQALATLREDPRGDRRLVAYVVPEAGGEDEGPAGDAGTAAGPELSATAAPGSLGASAQGTAGGPNGSATGTTGGPEGRAAAAASAPGPGVAGWRELLRYRLPEFMVPSAFVLLDALPLTPSGKVDRRARLPEPDWDVDHAGAAFVAPRGPVEALLASIWSDLLDREQVGAADDFFALGGHSLLATRMLSRVREVLGVELPLRAVFEARTLGELAARIEELRGTGPREPLAGAPGAMTDGDAGAIPLSFAQQRLWFFDQFEPGSVLFNTPVALRLVGPLAPALLARTLAEVRRRHQVLRTTFRSADGQAVQVIAEGLPALPLPLADLSALQAPERDAEVERRIAAEAVLPFDLARGPLLRATLLRLGPAEHALVLNLHHIISDRWSLAILRREIAAIYGAWSRGEPSPLPALPLQYADHARRQRREATGEVLAGELAFWRRLLDGAPHVLELPTDRPRPAVRSLRGRSRPVALPAGLVKDLEVWGRHRGVTPFMTLLGAMGALLGRYADQEEILVGSAIAGRERRELEELLGLFVNTLVLRVDMRRDPGFDLLAERVRAMALEAYAHPSLPFERLVEELAPARDLSRSPLYQVALSLQNVPAEKLRIPGLDLVPLPVESHSAQQDLLLLLAEVDGGLAGFWEYSADLFDAATIDRMTGHLATLLAGVVADSGRRLSDLPLLAPAERHQLLAEWNDTEDRAGAERGAARLDQLLAAAVARAPERVAVTFDGRHLTYGELLARAGRLSGRLRALGVGPERLVGVAAEEGLERIVGIAGVLLAGGAFLPLDPRQPAERTAWMLADAGVQALVTQRALAAALPREGAPVVLLDEVRGAEGPEVSDAVVPEESERDVGGPGRLAYVIYTSGSTGRPKGVMVSHGAIVHLLVESLRHTDADEWSRMTQLLAFGFDAAVLETWYPITAAGTLCLVGAETRLSGVGLAEILRREQVTAMVCTPPILATIPSDDLPALHGMIIGGDRFPVELAGRWVGGGRAVMNAYGPTETAVYSSFRLCPDPCRRDPTIGRPIENTRMLVMDRHARPVPVGVPGELWIGGAGVARGYLNRPELTAERFVPDPTGGDALGARLYRTGDLVRWVADGEIEFLGRVDRQVKIRGLRIEPGEIEAALLRHPAVGECAVVVREDAPSEKMLVAYLVAAGREPADREPAKTEAARHELANSELDHRAPADGVQADRVPDGRELRAALAGELPPYMIPAVFVTVPALPLSPNGKVDLAALPAPRELPGRDEAYVAPRTPGETALAAIWSQVLCVERVGVHDNFFELGGDSIRGVQVVARAQQAGLSVTAKDLFQHQTVAELAAAAGAVRPSEADEAGEIPLTPVQRWFFAGDPADPHHFNQPLLLDLRQAVDRGHLERALEQVAGHHAALRLRFPRDDHGSYRQAATGAAAVPTALLDLSALPPSRRRPALEAAAAALQGSLDLEHGPLVRAALFSLGARGQRLLLAAHHLVVDAVSWRVLLADLESAHRAIAAGRRADLPPVATSLVQWTARLSAYARSSQVAEELPYWLDPSRTAVRPLPVDRPGMIGVGASARTVVLEVDADETQALLHEVTAAYRARVPDALLTALVQAFAGWTGERRLLVDLEGHGREELFDSVDLSRTVGWLTAVYPVLLELDRKERGPGDHLRAIKEQLWSVPRGGIGYGILRYLGDEDAAGRLRSMPSPEVLFNYLGELDGTLTGSSLFARASESPGPARSPRQRRVHLLEIDAAVLGGRLRSTWTYGEDRHDRRTVEALASRYLDALRALIDTSRTPVAAGFTPTDFPEAKVSQRDLDKLMARIGKTAPRPGRGPTR